MIKSFTATTREIDDADAAIAEIKATLDYEGKLLKNSLGIVSCYSEFTETGVLKAVCEALPFDCVGAISCLSACAGEVDQIILAITVLTSDDCDFQAIEIPINENYKETIASVMAGALKKADEKPKLLLSFFPLMHTVSGDVMIEEIDKATGGIPLFGTTTVDHNLDFSTSQTVCNGESYRESVVLGAIYGNLKFSFDVASLEESSIRKQRAIITESNGNILTGVNGKSFMEYLEEIGLSREVIARGLGVFPLVIDYNDGTKPVGRAIFAITPEGHAVCGGLMPEGATIAIGRIDVDDVLSTVEETLTPFVDDESVIICYTCMARYLALGVNSTAEAERVMEIASRNNYILACSGGEIAPLPNEAGKMRNFFHNFTIIFCKLS
jgi:hypothetical protein